MLYITCIYISYIYNMYVYIYVMGASKHGIYPQMTVLVAKATISQWIWGYYVFCSWLYTGVDPGIYSQLYLRKSMPHSWYISMHIYRYIHTSTSIYGYPYNSIYIL